MNDEFFRLIEDHDQITIFGHMNPDGDCYGSELGLKEALKHFYPQKKVYAIGGGYKRHPADLPEFDEVDDETIKDSLAIVVDLANSPRISDKRAFLAPVRIKVDHHLFSDRFADLEIIEDDRVACAEIIANLFFDRFGYLPKAAAEPLFLGIVTDSGRFLYSPTDARLFKTVSHLLKAGVDTKKIYDSLYETEPESLRFKAYVYQNFKIDEGIAYMVFSTAELQRLGLSKDEAAVQVNLIGSLKGCYAWVFFSEGLDGKVRVELRSGGFPVQPVAVAFGGGGHRQASGCVLEKLTDYLRVLETIKSQHAAEGI